MIIQPSLARMYAEAWEAFFPGKRGGLPRQETTAHRESIGRLAVKVLDQRSVAQQLIECDSSSRRVRLEMVDFRGSPDARVFDAYPWILAIGVLISLLWLGLQPSLQDDEVTSRIDAALVALLAGLLAARIGYVAGHWNYFSARPESVLYFWQGGLSWAGGVVGASIGLAIYLLLTRGSLRSHVDLLAIPAAIVAAAAWLGCLIDRCAYGMKTAAGVFTPPAPDMLGNVAPRWPTQFLGGLLSLIVVAVLYWLSQLELRPGVLGALSLALIALVALVLSFARGDPMPVLAGLRMDGLSSAAILSIGVIAIVVSLSK